MHGVIPTFGRDKVAARRRRNRKRRHFAVTRALMGAEVLSPWPGEYA